ncbi:trace amine-associated receptor 1-like [Symphorus nematophorus]
MGESSPEDMSHLSVTQKQDVSWEEHMSHLQCILQYIRAAGLTINPQKYAVAQKEVECLGHVNGFGKIKPQVGKVEVIQDFPVPATKKKVEEFHGPGCSGEESPGYLSTLLKVSGDSMMKNFKAHGTVAIISGHSPKSKNWLEMRTTRPHFEAMLTYILLSSISLITTALNLLVIISISHFKQLHTPTNFLLLSLAVSDFLVGFLLMPVEFLLIEACWILGDLMCALYYLLPVSITTASVGNMVLISVDRYVAICNPLHYSIKVTQKNVKMCVFLFWIGAGFYSVILLYDNLKQPGRYNYCIGECVINITGALDVVVNFIIPITIIVVLYMRVFVVAVSQARAMKSHTAAVSLKHSKAVKVQISELKAARTLGILVVVFLICYSPYYCVSLTGHDILIVSSKGLVR